MTIHSLIKYIKEQLKEVEKELNTPHERTDGAYFMGKKVVLLDILHKLEEDVSNDNPNDYKRMEDILRRLENDDTNSEEIKVTLKGE